MLFLAHQGFSLSPPCVSVCVCISARGSLTLWSEREKFKHFRRTHRQSERKPITLDADDDDGTGINIYIYGGEEDQPNDEEEEAKIRKRSTRDQVKRRHINSSKIRNNLLA